VFLRLPPIIKIDKFNKHNFLVKKIVLSHIYILLNIYFNFANFIFYIVLHFYFSELIFSNTKSNIKKFFLLFRLFLTRGFIHCKDRDLYYTI